MVGFNEGFNDGLTVGVDDINIAEGKTTGAMVGLERLVGPIVGVPLGVSTNKGFTHNGNKF